MKPNNERKWTPEEKASALARLERCTREELIALAFDWESNGRPDQRAPEGDWTTWLLIGGRGSGKTRAGAEWVRELATGDFPVTPIALVGETMAEARAIMVEGESGLLRVHHPDHRPKFEAGRGAVIWPNGVKAILMPANDPERFRGPQFAAAWCDELAKWPKAEAAWDMLQFGLRVGARPRQLVTTTPRATKLLKRLMADKDAVVRRMPTFTNTDNLSPNFVAAIVSRYRDTVLGRQELDGEMVEEMPGALWNRGQVEAARMAEAPALSRMVVAVDPPVTGKKTSDACGIVVAGRWGEKAVVLADRTVQGTTPLGWARVAVKAFHEFAADTIIAEVNQDGDLVKTVLAQIDPAVPVREARANRGKWLRAEPVAALYAQGRVKHAGMFAELEDELCAFGPDGRAEGHSPDRLDALVWAVTELLLRDGPVPRVRV